MDGESRFSSLYRILQHLGGRRRAYEQFSDATIVACLLWRAIHNKPDHWLCHTDHLPGPLAQLAQRPSAATLSRRGRSTPVLQLIEQCVQALLTLHALGRSRVKLIDAMPLRVGFGSHDRTARFGYGGGGKARGYKLMVILDACTGLVEDWLVMPMNVDEAKAARQLVGACPRGQYLIGDNLFDKNHLYDLAATRGVQLIAPPKRSARGLGHRPHSPAHLHAHRILQRRVGSELMRLRGSIERRFGNLTSHHLGLTHLPAWVRGLGRVGRWCGLKLLSNALARTDTQALTPTMQ